MNIKPTTENVAAFREEAAHLGGDQKIFLLRQLGWLRPARRTLGAGVPRALTHPSAAPPPRDFNAAVKAAAGESSTPSAAQAPSTRLGELRGTSRSSHLAPPPPDLNARVRAAQARR
jgi:hypothetical protein